MIDLRTILLGYSIGNMIALFVMIHLWVQNRKDSPAILYWMIDYVFQFLGILIIFLRGIIPDNISILLGAPFVIIGTAFLYSGLSDYLGVKSSKWIIAGIPFLYLISQVIFTYIQPNLAYRNIAFSIALFTFSILIIDLTIIRTRFVKKQSQWMIGAVFIPYAGLCLLRVIHDLSVRVSQNLFLSDSFDSLIILGYQMLFMALTFSLILMVNKKVLNELSDDIDQRISSEAELSISQKKLKLIFDNIPDAIIISEFVSGKIIEFNPGFLSLTGYQTEEVTGKTIFDLNLWRYPDARGRLLEIVDQAGRVTNLEAEFIKKNGEVLIGSISTETINLPEGECLLSLVRDITKQKETTEALIHMASFPRLNPNPVLEVNKEGTITYQNEAVQLTLNNLGENDPQIFIPDTVPSIFEIPEDVHPPSIEVVTTIHNHHFSESLHFVPEFKTVRIYTTDITNQKIFENKLLETSNYLRALIENANSPIITWDEKRYITSFNRAFERATGYSSADMIGKPIQILFPEGQLSEIIELITEAEEGKNLETAEIPIQTSSGQVRILLWNTAKIYSSSDNNPIATIAQGQDITERKFAEEVLAQTKNELEQLLSESEHSRRVLLSVVEDKQIAEERIKNLNETLEQRVINRTEKLERSNKELEAFAYSISHDLRTPLRAIDGFTRILEQEYSHEVDEEGRRLMKIIRQNTRKMDQLITDILALSRVSRNLISSTRISMPALIETTLNEFNLKEYNTDTKLIIEELPDVVGDPVLLRQVWMNLLMNAIKYSKSSEPPTITIGGFLENGYCTYYVKDNGVGFNPKYSDKLFGLFQRLHKESEFEGTGVGLAIVKRIIQRHNGRVWAESTQGLGAKFYFSIPREGTLDETS